jgi:hypothetical protein
MCKLGSVVHCKHEQFDIYIGRPSKWGNPFSIGKDGSRAEVIEKYAAWVMQQPELMSTVHELLGKRLGCWCSPAACHGEVLLKLAASSIPEFDEIGFFTTRVQSVSCCHWSVA